MGPADPSRPGPWAAPLAAWTTAQRAAGYAASTIALRSTDLGRLATTHADRSPWSLTTADLAAWLAIGRPAAETRRSRRATLRSFYSWAVETGRTEHDPAAGLARVPATAPRPRPVRDADYRAALAAAGPREALMLRLAAEVGMRRGEVARVHSADLLDEDDGWSLLVHGKGNRDRVIPLPDALAATLRALPPGWAFPGDDHGHLSPRTLGALVSHLLPPGVAMHALRHTFATNAYRLEHDIYTVQQLLGHASPSMTRRYVETTAAEMRATVRTLERTHR